MKVPSTPIEIRVAEGYFTADYVPFDVCLVAYLTACGVEPSIEIHTISSGDDLKESPPISKAIRNTVFLAGGVTALYLAIKYLPALFASTGGGSIDPRIAKAAMNMALEKETGGYFNP